MSEKSVCKGEWVMEAGASTQEEDTQHCVSGPRNLTDVVERVSVCASLGSGRFEYSGRFLSVAALHR